MKECEQCGRVLPRRSWNAPAGSWRATCATCRKPAEKRRHMRAIYREQQAAKAQSVA